MHIFAPNIIILRPEFLSIILSNTVNKYFSRENPEARELNWSTCQNASFQSRRKGRSYWSFRIRNIYFWCCEDVQMYKNNDSIFCHCNPQMYKKEVEETNMSTEIQENAFITAHELNPLRRHQKLIQNKVWAGSKLAAYWNL